MLFCIIGSEYFFLFADKAYIEMQMLLDVSCKTLIEDVRRKYEIWKEEEEKEEVKNVKTFALGSFDFQTKNILSKNLKAKCFPCYDKLLNVECDVKQMKCTYYDSKNNMIEVHYLTT